MSDYYPHDYVDEDEYERAERFGLLRRWFADANVGGSYTADGRWSPKPLFSAAEVEAGVREAEARGYKQKEL